MRKSNESLSIEFYKHVLVSFPLMKTIAILFFTDFVRRDIVRKLCEVCTQPE